MRVPRLVCFAFLLLCLTALGASAATHTIPVSTTETHMTLSPRQGDELRYDVAVGEIQALDVMTKRGEFTRLIIPDFHFSQDEGAPELPMMNRLIEIPYGASARIEVIADDSRMIDLAQYGITHPLFPMQPSMSKSADPATVPFVVDDAAYAADRVAHDLVKIVPVGRMRSVDIGRVEVSPVEYFPATNQIRVHERMEFRIVFEGVDYQGEIELKAKTASPFFDGMYEQAIDGLRTPHTDHPDLVRDVVTMVIITPANYQQYLQEFIDWKTQRGFNVIVGVMGTPEVGSTTTSIRAYIANLYNNPAPGMQAPSFVVFVGDVEQCPTFFEGGDAKFGL